MPRQRPKPLVVDAPPQPLGTHLRACRLAAEPTVEERRERRERGRADPPAGITLAELVARLTAMGSPTTWSALSKLENGGDVRWSRALRIAAACGFDAEVTFRPRRQGA